MNIEEKDGIVYIHGKKKDLNPYQRLMIKAQPEKYVLVKPKKEKKEHKILSPEEREAQKQYKLYEANLKFWRDIDKEIRNSKKNKNKNTKREKQLNKYFEKRNKKVQKKEKKFLDDHLWAKMHNMCVDARYEEILSDMKKPINSSKRFMASFRIGSKIDLSDSNKMSLLKELENEVLFNLNEDMFESERLIVEYYKGDKKKFKKRNKDRTKQSKKNRKSSNNEDYINALIYDMNT